MGYTELKNQADLRKNTKSGLEGAALTFIRESCEKLRFDQAKKEQEDEKKRKFLGTSLHENEIPYNMQMDIDRLCLENAVRRFLDTGKKEDAFDVYFCYLEMFVGDYEKTRRMIELLSEFEANGSGLLMKHRDHYSHSVYVFILGLAIYQSNKIFRSAYKEFYENAHEEGYDFIDDHQIAHHFLKYWGLSSLFHDIGYPFELPFEQVASYFEVEGDKREKRPFVSYSGLESFVKLNKSMQRKIGNLYGLSTDKMICTTDELFAYALYQKLGEKYYFSEAEMREYLQTKPTEPNAFGHFMDHAYFSATVLYKKLFEELGLKLTKEYIDSLTAILLHNSLYKFSIAFYKDPVSNKRLKAEWHPLAFMLMLCDELQCWDRIAYGRNSKKELHPMGSKFAFSDEQIQVTYIFDESESNKVNKFTQDYDEWEKTKKGNRPGLKAYSSMVVKEEIERDDGTRDKVSSFQADIERIVDLSKIRLDVTESKLEGRTQPKGYLSDSNFIELFNFATVLNGRWGDIDAWKDAKENNKIDDFLSDDKRLKKIRNSFKALSLEYKLSNISQAKAFAKYMNEIGCFYTGKTVDFDLVEGFNEKEWDVIGPLEHQRWLQEHYDMGWKYISEEELAKIVQDKYGLADKESDEFKKVYNQERELQRSHWDMISGLPADVWFESSGKEKEEKAKEHFYENLNPEEQNKDREPMECMLAMLSMFDGLRIYRLNK